MENENLNENYTDDFYEEKVNENKYGVMKMKLTLLVEIIQTKMKLYFLFFKMKSELKIELEELFNKDDNFLFIFPREKICKFDSHYAIKRLIYVIKKYRFRQCYLMKGSFELWRTQASIRTLIANPINQSKRNQLCVNFLTKVCKIFTKKTLVLNLYKLAFVIWFNKSKGNLITLSKYTRASIILYNVINRRINYFFLKFPRNCLYLRLFARKLKGDFGVEGEDENTFIKAIEQFRTEKNTINSLRKRNFLTKIILSQNLKFCVNKDLYLAFKKFKMLVNSSYRLFHENQKLTEAIIDLKCDSLINGCIMLKIILNKRIQSKLLISKREFYRNFVRKVKMINTLMDYTHKYKSIPGMLKGDTKIDLLVLRKEYQKVFSLVNIFIIRMRHKFWKFYNNTNVNIGNDIGTVQSLFYRWKGIIIRNLQDESKKKIFLSEVLTKLYYRVSMTGKCKFVRNLMLISFFDKQKKELNLCYASNLLTSIQTVYNKNLRFFLSRLSNKKSERDDVNEHNNANSMSLKKISLKVFLLLYGRHKIKKTKKLYFNKWKLNSTIIIIFEKKSPCRHKSSSSTNLKDLYYETNSNSINYFRLSKILSVLFLLSTKYLKNKFRKWKYNSKTHYSLSNISIDTMIIQNMSTILQEYENEDNKLKQEILKLKTSLSRNHVLSMIIYAKHFNNLLYFFTLWNRNTNTITNYSDLINQNELIKKENDALISTYYEKKNQYKRTIYDFEYMKKHYCQDCIGEPFEIDYKSINNDALSEENMTEENDSEMRIDTNEDYHTNRLQNMVTEETPENKITIKENEIKEYQNEYNAQLKYYEDYISTMEKKKEELISMKQQLLSQS